MVRNGIFEKNVLSNFEEHHSKTEEYGVRSEVMGVTDRLRILSIGSPDFDVEMGNRKVWNVTI